MSIASGTEDMIQGPSMGVGCCVLGVGCMGKWVYVRRFQLQCNFLVVYFGRC